MMFTLHGYKLDDYHMISELQDKDGSKSWWLFTFPQSISDDSVDLTMDNNQTLFDMKQIDPEHFEWDGKVLRIEKE